MIPDNFLIPALLALAAIGFSAAHEYAIWKKLPMMKTLEYGRKVVWILSGISFSIALILPLSSIQGK